MNSSLTRAWKNLSWWRLFLAAVVAPLPALYIGFAAVGLAFSDRNLVSVYRLSVDTVPFVWGFALGFPLLYLNLISRWRGRVSGIECIVMGSAAALLLALMFFIASVEFRLLGPLPYMFFFPGVVMAARDGWFWGGATLGAILAPAGALSGWIFWRLGIAPAPIEDKVELF
jgi:hypothetical protein